MIVVVILLGVSIVGVFGVGFAVAYCAEGVKSGKKEKEKSQRCSSREACELCPDERSEEDEETRELYSETGLA